MNTDTPSPGDRFGYLVVLGVSPIRRHRTTHYRCLCACGKETTQRAMELRSGRVVSCGCVGALGRAAARNEQRIRAEHQRRIVADDKAAKAENINHALRVLSAFVPNREAS